VLIDRGHRRGSAVLERIDTRLLTVFAALSATAATGLLVAYEYLRWRDFDLGVDYAIINQGTHLVALGRLWPTNTVYGGPFVLLAFQLIFLPIGLLRGLADSGLLLLVLQAIAVGATFFVIAWIAIGETEGVAPTWRILTVGAVGALAVANPWALEAVSFDVHGETFGALGLVLALAGALRGRRVLFGVGTVLALMSGSGTLLVALGTGLGMVALRRTRGFGAVLAVSAGALILTAELLHASGVAFGLTYGYLAGPGRNVASTGMGAVLRAVLLHPSRPLRVLGSRAVSIEQLVGYGGVLGLLSPIGLVPIVLAVLVNGLIVTSNFIDITEGFQNWPGEAILLVATAVVLGGWVRRVARRDASNPDALSSTHLRAGRIWMGLALAGIALIVGLALRFDVSVPRTWFTQPYDSVRALRALRTRVAPNDEVVGTINAIARISARGNLFYLSSPAATVPVCNRSLDVVTEVPGPYGILSGPRVAAFDKALRRSGRAHVLLDRAGVMAFRFSGLEPGREVLMLPSGAVVGGRGAEALDSEQCNP